MPTYGYRCADCGHQFEQFQKFSEDALTVCPSCNGTIKRVIQPVGVVFKGSGFYVNDSRKSDSGSTTKAPAAEKTDATPTAKPETAEKSESKEAATPAPPAKESKVAAPA